jgi:tRNA pseudouridine55 synthase
VADPAERVDQVDGLVVVDKPPGWTSHDVVARCRKIFGQRRVGHSGTLDPDATGVLLVGLGRVTRLLRYLTALSKSYAGEVVLGATTTTLDDSGEVVQRFDMAGVTIDDVRAAASKLVGDIEQVPPMVSAVKVGGRRLHAAARRGEEIERKPRPVTVTRFDVAPTADAAVFAIEVDCSSGTYIRSLAADVGAALGGGAHLRALRRTAIGSFNLDDAVPLDAVGVESVLAPVDALRDYPAATVDDDDLAAARHGRRVHATSEGAWRLVDGDGQLVAVYEGDRAAVVIRPATSAT